MTKIEQAEQWLRGGIPQIWDSTHCFSRDERERLAAFPQTSVTKLFHPTPPEGNAFSATDVQCGKCNATSDCMRLSKTKVMEVIYTPSKWVCAVCVQSKKAEDAAFFKRRDIEWQEEKARFNETFFEHYLSPGKEWCIPPHQWYNQMRDVVRYCRDEDVRLAIRSMRYNEFLKTPYWKAVAQQVRWRAKFKCQLCNAGGQTHVHHRHYDTHGMEHENLHDLICLCANCHKTHHAK